jgi:hypothetical protein
MARHLALSAWVSSAEISRYSATELVEIIAGSEQSNTYKIYVSYT